MDDPPHAAFEVHLENFTGPFDLLLGLISKHRLDITEVALATVTDDFIAHIRARDGAWDLDEASGFLVIASTLLDLKAARLLPTGEVEDDEDLALLEARDLLFARLLQYRAFKDVASSLEGRLEAESGRVPRPGGLDPALGRLLPELVLGIGPEQLALIAAAALAPKPEPSGVHLDHLHAPPVSVREQASLLVTRLRRHGTSTFRGLVADAGSTTTVVARFLAVLELFREGVVAFEQVSPLAELTIRWTGEDSGDVEVADEFDARGEDGAGGPAALDADAGGGDGSDTIGPGAAVAASVGAERGAEREPEEGRDREAGRDREDRNRDRRRDVAGPGEEGGTPRRDA